jgi:hypothetical protein
MKYLIPLLIFFLTINESYAQKLKSVESYDMEMGIDETKKRFATNFEVTKELILNDDSKIIIGQEMKLGESSSKISNQYESLFMGRYSPGKSLLAAPTYVNTNWKQYDFVVEEIKMSRLAGSVSILVRLKNMTTQAVGFRYVTATNLSFDNGEIINPNKAITREEAIAKLKEAKDLLDLDLMSQEEYDALREELTPIIRGSN